ncbi:MAG: hypothetical protein RIG82_05595 [Phycisphaeraceae bacterium]
MPNLPNITASLLAATLTLSLCSPSPAAEQPISIVGPRVSLGPLADPVVDAQAILGGQRVTTWTETDATRWFLLEDNATFAVGSYRFAASRALVRVQTRTIQHQTIHILTVFLLDASPGDATGPIEAATPRMTLSAATRGGLAVDANLLLQPDAAPDSPIITQARSAFARLDLARATPTLAINPSPAVTDDQIALKDLRRAEIERRRAEIDAVSPALADQPEPSGLIDLPTEGRISFAAGRAVARGGDTESTLTLVGGITVIYTDPRGDTTLRLTAEKAVLFADGNFALSGSLDADKVTAIYLEDNAIISDGVTTVRAPRMLVDTKAERALLFEAVAYTYDPRRQIPIYIRAEEIRQVAGTAAVATNVTLATSAFAQPHFGIGAEKLAVNVARQPDGSAIPYFAADDATVRVNDTPIFYTPRLSGRGQEIPLRSIDAGFSNQNGLELQTEWDLFALTGKDQPQGVDLSGRFDVQGQHGVALGAEVQYDRPNALGQSQFYVLPFDQGEDEVGGRNAVGQEGEFRGFLHTQHLQQLEQGWRAALQLAVVSDETFLEEFFPDEAYAALPYETSLYLANTDHETTFSLFFRYDANNFIEQLPELQAQPWRIDEAPRLSYFRQGTPLGSSGVVYLTENNYSYQRIRFSEDAPEDRGFDTMDSLINFGDFEFVSFDDSYAPLGIPDSWRHRIDTRHELSASRRLGIVDVNPFAAGRFVGYSESANSPFIDDPNDRFWGALGVRLHTTFIGSNSNVRSRILNIDGVRHIIEPSSDLFIMGTSYDTDQVFILDNDTDRLSDGAGTRIGILQTWQTRRQALGQTRTVDWIRLRTDAIFRSSESIDGAIIPRYHAYRPELSRGGDHLFGELAWLVTDQIGFISEVTHDLENQQTAQWKSAVTFEHDTRLTSFINYQQIHQLDSSILGYGAGYQMTAKYRALFEHRLDLEEGGSRDVLFSLDRKLPSWRLRFTADFDQIDNESSLSVSLQPQLAQQRAGEGLLPYDNID